MTISDPKLYAEALSFLRLTYGSQAEFRPGQYEAIEATMLHRRTLVVQRTGWGKSLVYFLCTMLLRSRGAGITLVVSPLLVLMKNQMEAAERLGLRCDALNSETADRREWILNAMVRSAVDLIFVTPETLFRDDVQSRLPDISIGLFVIDEAHCISDWGHDFRLEYSRLKDVIAMLPYNVPVLATTATANDRVIADLQKQLGQEVYVSRGPLSRESLSIQILNLPDRKDRYAWMLANLPKLPGSGIIYCLTQRDCDYLADFLISNGISAMSYYSRNKQEEERNRKAEASFRDNQIKALVATIKLGMGYDKGDIAFVIHFQMPANVVSYYQQIGRAGRSIERAYIFLMSGQEDEEILDYFVKTAFPTEEDTLRILDCVRDAGGMTLRDLEAKLNMRRSRIEKAVTFLLKDGYLYKENSIYFVTPKPFVYQREHYQSIMETRYQEIEQMKAPVHTRDCYSQFIVRALDDRNAPKCGHCANCLRKNLLPAKASFLARQKASEYINGLTLTIEPRKMWVNSAVTEAGKIAYINQNGICLSKYGDAGYGALVKRDKYSAKRRFCDELVGKSAQLLRPLIRDHKITHITCVPSLRSDLVQDFSRRLAKACRVPFVELLRKRPVPQQKHMENSAHQCANAFVSFSIIDDAFIPEKVILIDDVVDSRWTMTVCGYRLMQAGCKEVYPFALADSSLKGGSSQ